MIFDQKKRAMPLPLTIYKNMDTANRQKKIVENDEFSRVNERDCFGLLVPPLFFFFKSIWLEIEIEFSIFADFD